MNDPNRDSGDHERQFGAAEPIEASLLDFVRTELLEDDQTVGPEDELLTDLLDSVAVLRLATFVDETFDVTTRPQDFVVENYRTITVLARYVLSRRQED